MSNQPTVLLLLVATATACGTDAQLGTHPGGDPTLEVTAPALTSAETTSSSAPTGTAPSPILEPSPQPGASSSETTTDTASTTDSTTATGTLSASVDDETSAHGASSGAATTVTSDGYEDTTSDAAETPGQVSSVAEPTTTADDSQASSTSTEDSSACPRSGNIQYRLNGAESWPSDVRELLTQAMDEALAYYNCYADLSHQLIVNYDGSVPTAQANVDGWITFGNNRSYMVVATAMHEVAHTLGVGFFPWDELLRDGRWIGSAVNELMASIPVEERDPDYGMRDYITADRQHFWPYGLNYASEHLSEWSLINHVRVVAAMARDKEAYLRSR